MGVKRAEELDARTFAIGEPRYCQQNYSDLMVDSERWFRRELHRLRSRIDSSSCCLGASNG